MVGELVMLPVRVGVRVTRLWFRAVEETVSVTTDVTGRLVGLLASRSPNGTAGETLPLGRPGMPGAPPSPPEPRTTDPITRGPTELVDPEPEPVPVHVSEEPVLVEDFAEPGAEDGAGAEVHVEPPWDGYERMSAKEIIARLGSADPAELATVQLYEANNRRRQTVINAVERELRIANARGSRDNHRP